MNKHHDNLSAITKKHPSLNLEAKLLKITSHKMNELNESPFSWFSISIPLATLSISLFLLLQITHSPFEQINQNLFEENIELIEYHQALDHLDVIENVSDEDWNQIISES